MLFRVPRCYDSHVHLMATGQVALGLQLHSLKSPSDISKLKIEKHHFRGTWLVGFGWDEHSWSSAPTKEILDRVFPDFPVNFSRIDGHASWFNSKAFEMLGIDPRTQSGILVDTPKIAADMKLPAWSKPQETEFLKKAFQIFNRNGFTHIRDMSGNLAQWDLLAELEEKNELTLYVEENFTCESKEDFGRALGEAITARSQKRKHLKVLGIKFYTDGALGSGGAYLSSGQGELLWPLADMEYVIRKTWENKFQISIHAIGDEAADQTVRVALKIYESGLRGRINLEHAQVLRDNTIELLKKMDAVCYMQPCHWLSDRVWLEKKLGPLYHNAFPWKKLAAQNTPLYWGSDSPIEAPSVFNNLKALRESVSQGIGAYAGDVLLPHIYPDSNWGGECISEFTDESVRSVMFDGAHLKI